MTMPQIAAVPRLTTLEEALALGRDETIALHERYLNPRMMKVYEFIGIDRVPVRAEGAYFWDGSGTRYTDVLSAFGTLALGHNPPPVLAALDVLRARGTPNLVEGPSPLAAALAPKQRTRRCWLIGGDMAENVHAIERATGRRRGASGARDGGGEIERHCRV